MEWPLIGVFCATLCASMLTLTERTEPVFHAILSFGFEQAASRDGSDRIAHNAELVTDLGMVRHQGHGDIDHPGERDARSYNGGDEHRERPLRHFLLSAQILNGVLFVVWGGWGIQSARKRARPGSADALGMYLFAHILLLVAGGGIALFAVFAMLAGP